MRRAPFIAGTLVAAASLTRTAAAGPRAITVGYVPSTLFAPLFVATDRGYLTGAGFTPSLQPIVAGQDAMALLAQGAIDAVAAGLSAAFFNAVARGFDVRLAASTGYQPRHGHPSALMVRSDLAAGIRGVAGLRGKKVAWNGGAGATSAYYVDVILRSAHMSLSDIETVDIGNPDQAVALERKAIDAVFASSPFTEYFTDRKLAQDIAEVPAGISGTGIFVGPTLLRDPAGASSFLRALRHGSADLQGGGYDRTETLATLAKYTHVEAAVLRRAGRYDFKPDLAIDRATLADMQREFVRQAILTYATPIPAAKLTATF